MSKIPKNPVDVEIFYLNPRNVNIKGSEVCNPAQRNNDSSGAYSTLRPQVGTIQEDTIQKPEHKNLISNRTSRDNDDYLILRVSTLKKSSKSPQSIEMFMNADGYLVASDSIHYEGSVASQLPESYGNVINSPQSNAKWSLDYATVIDSIKMRAKSKPSDSNEKPGKPPKLPPKPPRSHPAEKHQLTKTSTTKESQKLNPSSITGKELIHVQQSSLSKLNQDVQVKDKNGNTSEKLGNRQSIFIVEWKCPNCNFVNPGTNLRCKRCVSQVPEHSKQYICFSDSLPQQERSRPPESKGIHIHVSCANNIFQKGGISLNVRIKSDSQITL